MTFPIEAINAQLARLSRHPWHGGRLPGRVEGAEDFAARVPTMTKGELQAEMFRPGHGGFAPHVPPVRINMTPTSDGLMPVMQSAADLDAMTRAARAHLDACGLGPGETCLVTFGYHLFVAGLFYQSVMEAHGIACIPHGPGEAERAVATAKATGATILAGAPSFALKLLDMGLPPPRVLFAGAEPFTGDPALYARVRAALPDTLLIDAYSLSEALPVGRTFPGGRGVHVFDELVWPEVLDPETGAPLPDGERGELVLTHLKKELQPLVRYRTGDLAVLERTAPIHGRTLCLPKVVFGRTDGMVKVKGVKFFPSEVRGMLLGLEGATRNYRVRIERKPGGGDRLTLAVEGALDADAEAELARRFKAQTLIEADAIEVVPELEDGPLMTDARDRHGE